MPDVSVKQKVKEVQELVRYMTKNIEDLSRQSNSRIAKNFTTSRVKAMRDADVQYKAQIKTIEQSYKKIATLDNNYNKNRVSNEKRMANEIRRAASDREKSVRKSGGLGARVEGSRVGRGAVQVGQALAAEHGMAMGGTLGTASGMLATLGPLGALTAAFVQLLAKEDMLVAKTKEFAGVSTRSWGDYSKKSSGYFADVKKSFADMSLDIYGNINHALELQEQWSGSYAKLGQQVSKGNIGRSFGASVAIAGQTLGIGIPEAVKAASDSMELFGDSTDKVQDRFKGIYEGAQSAGANMAIFTRGVISANDAMGELGDTQKFTVDMMSRLKRTGTADRYLSGYAQRLGGGLQGVAPGMAAYMGMGMRGGGNALEGRQFYRSVGAGMIKGKGVQDQQKAFMKMLADQGVTKADVEKLVTGKGAGSAIRGELGFSRVKGVTGGDDTQTLKLISGLYGIGEKSALTSKDFLSAEQQTQADVAAQRSKVDQINDTIETVIVSLIRGIESGVTYIAKHFGGGSTGFGAGGINKETARSSADMSTRLSSVSAFNSRAKAAGVSTADALSKRLEITAASGGDTKKFAAMLDAEFMNLTKTIMNSAKKAERTAQEPR